MTDVILRRVRPDQLRELVTILVIILLIVFFATQIQGYLSDRTFLRVTTSFPIVAVMAVGQVLVILTRNIDLSIGSQVGVVAFTVGSLLGSQPDLHPLAVVALAMGLGAAMGAINGAIVAYGRVPAIIVTLGTLALFRTLLIELGEARTITTRGFPDWLLDFPTVNITALGGLDIRLAFGITLAAVLIGQLVLRYLPFGRRLYAIGSNPEGAQTAGLPVRRDVFLAFVGCGAMAGLGGLLYLARFGNVTTVAGQGLELTVIAAVVVGGVNIFGGAGSMVSAFLGVILVEVLQQSLVRWIGISDFVRDFLLGVLILAAVASDKIVLGRLQQAWARVRRRDEALERERRESKVLGAG